MRIVAYLMSCKERSATRRSTIERLAATDWQEAVETVLDERRYERRQDRQEHTALRVLEAASTRAADFLLFLEDDLDFNRHLRHNLEHWAPLRQAGDGPFFASLYNPNVHECWRDAGRAFFVADPAAVYGSQAFLLSVVTARYVVDHWTEVIGMQDIKMSRLAARRSLIYYHSPSLVQHVGRQSTWGGHYHWATDFSANWRA
jgi:hypothetical protein